MKESLKILVSCLFCITMIAVPAMAADKVCKVTYEAQVLSRVGNQRALDLQPTIIAQSLAPVDGRMILQTEGYTLTWDANLGNETVWSENQAHDLSYYTDEYGRLAFTGDTVAGDIDVFGSEVHLRFQTLVGQTFWTGQLVTVVAEDGTINTTLRMATKKCVCKGSNDTDGCSGVNDCLNSAPCTYHNNSGDHNSKCSQEIVPDAVPIEVPGSPDP
jgi:hypothetical protein